VRAETWNVWSFDSRSRLWVVVEEGLSQEAAKAGSVRRARTASEHDVPAAYLALLAGAVPPESATEAAVAATNSKPPAPAQPAGGETAAAAEPYPTPAERMALYAALVAAVGDADLETAESPLVEAVARQVQARVAAELHAVDEALLEQAEKLRRRFGTRDARHANRIAGLSEAASMVRTRPAAAPAVAQPDLELGQ
jgi:hypothetical protein